VPNAVIVVDVDSAGKGDVGVGAGQPARHGEKREAGHQCSGTKGYPQCLSSNPE